ncbi:hypothetical protein RJ639_035480 [Escallonia herrerae]|uniref:GST C-terminal domain-containing protein n=1 Tax=Escallonia herrerae TaxID=1293975 RepID=A0AA88WQJ9_9ASTE|nr:hypothetical protein RJ639_035480 [Escallonia herrerae]
MSDAVATASIPATVIPPAVTIAPPSTNNVLPPLQTVNVSTPTSTLPVMSNQADLMAVLRAMQHVTGMRRQPVKHRLNFHEEPRTSKTPERIQLFENALIALCSHGSQKEKAVKSTIDALEKIEGEIKGKSFFGGEAIGNLDLVLGWISYLLPVWDEISSMQLLDPLKFPFISTWKNNFLEDPLIKDYLPPKEKMVVYFQKRSKELAPALASRRHAS